MSLLNQSLRDDHDFKNYGHVLALECYQMTEDMSLIGAKSPVNSKNVKTYFDGAFLHDFLMYYEDRRRDDPLLVDKYQVFLGVSAMEHGVKIEKEDLDWMQLALIRSKIREDQRVRIQEAFAEYGRTGSLEMGDPWVLVRTGK